MKNQNIEIGEKLKAACIEASKSFKNLAETLNNFKVKNLPNIKSKYHS